MKKAKEKKKNQNSLKYKTRDNTKKNPS